MHVEGADVPAKIRVGVIGYGVMGQRHSDAFRNCADAEVIGAVDPARGRDIENARLAAFHDLDDLLAVGVDAVVVATPATSHHRIIGRCLAAAKHVLAEKPLALSLDDATALVDRARSAGQILAVGHQDRFLLCEETRSLPWGRAVQITTRRTARPPDRVPDVGVLLDLAVHDVDLVRHLTGREYVQARIEVSPKRAPTAVETWATIDATLECGASVHHEVQWDAHARTREMTMTDATGGRRAITLTTTPAHHTKALGAQARAFIGACRGGRRACLATAEDGASAVRVVTGGLGVSR